MSPPSAGALRATADGTGIDDGSGPAAVGVGADRIVGSGFVDVPPGSGAAARGTSLAPVRAAIDRATAWLPADCWIASTLAIR